MFAGMVEGGARVIDMGLATTPACFMACVTEGAKYDGSVMLTASHLPFNRNGMKFFTSEGGLDKPDITDICARAAASSSRHRFYRPTPRNCAISFEKV